MDEEQTRVCYTGDISMGNLSPNRMEELDAERGPLYRKVAWEVRENELMDDWEIWEGDRQIAGHLKREIAESIVAAKERQGESVDLVWEHEQDDVFNVVADIDLGSARIEYAFKAGYLAASTDNVGR